MWDDNFPDHLWASFEQYIDSFIEFISDFNKNSFRLFWCAQIVAAGSKFATRMSYVVYRRWNCDSAKSCVI